MDTLVGTDIAHAANLLQQGKLVAIPTETVYGLAAYGLNEKAVAAVFAVKNRPSFDPLILHFPDLNAVEAFAGTLHPTLRPLAETYWPGPLTLLVPKPGQVPDLVTSGLSRVAVRVPGHPLTQELLRLIHPLAAPSANPFGYISPTTAKHVADQLGGKIPYILEGGPTQIGLESTIVGLEDGLPIVYRLGGIPLEALFVVLGNDLQVHTHSSSRPAAPGTLEKHYAPHLPVVLGRDIPGPIRSRYPLARLGQLRFSDTAPEAEALGWHAVLSPTGDINEAASRLFALLRSADTAAIDLLVVELAPKVGLGLAINDRLVRAASTHIS